jgi:hypothetical protein
MHFNDQILRNHYFFGLFLNRWMIQVVFDRFLRLRLFLVGIKNDQIK